MCVQNLKSAAVPVSEIIVGVANLQYMDGRERAGIYGRPTIRNIALVSSYKDYSSISTRLPDILDWSFDWGCEVGIANVGKRKPYRGW